MRRDRAPCGTAVRLQRRLIKQGEDGTPVGETCRKAGISQATYFNWKKKCAGLLSTEMKRLKQL
jgi:putative transposase